MPIDRQTSNNEIIALLDEIDSHNESDIDNLFEDSGTKYVAEEPVSGTKEHYHNILTPEADINNGGTASCCNTDPSKQKLKQKNYSLKWKRSGNSN